MNLEKRLEIWITARCCEGNPRGSRGAELNAIFRTIYTDCRFNQYRNEGNRHYYEDALHLMWRYFLRNLCDVTTARTSGSLVPLDFWWKWYLKIQNDLPLKLERLELWFISLAGYLISRKARSFLETRDYAVGRLLENLKGHLKNIQKRMQEEISHQEVPRINDDGTVDYPVDAVPNPEPQLTARQFNEFLDLLEADSDGELNHEANTLRGKNGTYTLTAQTYLLMRRRDDMTIQQIAAELDIPRGSLQGGAKPAKWKALERKLAQMAMDSVSE